MPGETPYPIAKKGPLRRGVDFAVKVGHGKVLTILDEKGQEKTIPVRHDQGVKGFFRDGWRFIKYKDGGGGGSNSGGGSGGSGQSAPAPEPEPAPAPAPEPEPAPAPEPKPQEEPEENFPDPMENNTTPIAPEDSDEYIPQDIKESKEKDESDGFWQISPPLPGYYYNGKKSYFDGTKNIWSKKKKLQNYQPQAISTRTPKHFFTGTTRKGIVSMPLPLGTSIDLATVHPSDIQIQTDQNGCLYCISRKKQDISFHFHTLQGEKNNGPIGEDSRDIVGNAILSDPTNKLLRELNSATAKNSEDKAEILRAYISSSKKYHTEYQGHIHRTSKGNNYFTNLDASPVLECFSAATLFVGLCRKIGIPARLCGGHLITHEKNGASHMTNNTGHAWAEIWNGAKWVLMDATPTEKDNKIVDDAKEKEEKEKERKRQDMERMKEMGFTRKADYEEYKRLIEEIEPQVRQIIRAITAMLPKEEIVEVEDGYKSGLLDAEKLIKWRTEGDAHIFQRTVIEEGAPIMQAYEVIGIDASGSMYDSLSAPGDTRPLSTKDRMHTALRASLIYSQVLNHFGVPTELIFFGAETEKVMGWRGSINGKKTFGSPAQIMEKAKNGMPKGTIFESIFSHCYGSVSSFKQTPEGKNRKGSITIITDGGITSQDNVPNLERIRSRMADENMALSVYHIGGDDIKKLQAVVGEENIVSVGNNIPQLPGLMTEHFKKTVRQELMRLGLMAT